MLMAKQKELDSWIMNKVYQEVADTGLKCRSTRRVCTLKDTTESIMPKARLVAKRFEELENKEIEKDSPTCAKESLRLILTIMAQYKRQP